MKSAIVLDGSTKSALAVVRSLGLHGVSVSVGAERGTAMVLHSRHAKRTFVYPSPYEDVEGFITAIVREAHDCGDEPVMYAMSDATFLALNAHRERIQKCATFISPEENVVELVFNKAATYSFASVTDVPTIPTHIPEREEEVPYLADTLTYPVVVKPRRSVSWREGRGVFGTATFVHTKKELCDTFATLKKNTGEAPLVQQMVYGEEYGVEALTHQGTIFAMVSHHRIRSLSPTGGASVLKETLDDGDLKHTLEEYANTLIQKLKWSGPIMIEFKVDSDSLTPFLMEINGRFWGSLPLSIAAGVDVPFLYYTYASSGEVPMEMIRARDGVVTRHFLGDVRHLARTLFSRDTMRSLLYPRRFKALRDFCSLPKGTQSDVWSWRDPAPALYEVIDVMAKYIHRT